MSENEDTTVVATEGCTIGMADSSTGVTQSDRETALSLNDPPSSVDKEYCNGTSAQKCPRGCSTVIDSSYGRTQHYKKFHYNVYYLLVDESCPPLEKWLCVQFGDNSNDDRVCVRCVGRFRTNLDYRNRIELINHIQLAHPVEYSALVRDYGSMPHPTVHNTVHLIFMETATEPAASTATAEHQETETTSADAVDGSVAVASSAVAPLALDAMPCAVDSNYWHGTPKVGGCPRGCIRCTNNDCDSRIRHYKKYHYNVYFSLVDRPSWTPLDRWMHVQFGDNCTDTRVCVRCVGIYREKLEFRNRAELVCHILSGHPVEYSNLVRDHSNIPGARSPDLILLSQAPATASAISTRSSLQSATTVPPSKRWKEDAAAAAPTLSLEAPPCQVDSEYWKNRPTTTGTVSGYSGCPRGCIFFADTCRRDHYKRHHYDIYYALVKNQSWTPLDRWMNIHLGENNKDIRVCVRCFGDRRKFTFYRSRVELIRHIRTAHPSEMSELSRECCVLTTGTGVNVPDEEVYAILLNTPIVLE